jgi:radical SAM protein with 4Fe4S-binding SPASM domain
VDCSFQPEIDLDEWSKKLFAPLKGRRYPLGASIELTERCNLDCVHCYIKQSATNRAVKSRELDAEQWGVLIDQMAEAGCLFLLITGGEPLLHPEFIKIFKHARQRGMLVSLFSNATMLTEEIADFFVKYNLNALEVSLYGATRETYERISGVPGSYDRCLRGVELSLERQIPISLKTVLLTLNQHELGAIRELVESFGLSFRYDGTLWPRLDGDLTPMVYQISDEDLLWLDIEDQGRLEGWRHVAEQFEGHYLRSEYVFTCGAAQRSFHVDAYGSLSACMMVRKPAYNLLTISFNKAWEALGEIRNWKRQDNTECETCAINALCPQCPGWSLAIHGDFETPVKYICELAKKRAELLFPLKHKSFEQEELFNEKS